MKKKQYFACILLVVLGLLCPMDVHAANATYSAVFPEKAVLGEEIEVQIVVKDNPGLTTLGLRLEYDDHVLHYKRAEWSQELDKKKNKLTLVSDVSRTDGQALNVTMIDSAGYQKDGVCVSLYFDVLRAYEESPVKLKLRNSSDLNEEPAGGVAKTMSVSDKGPVNKTEEGGDKGTGAETETSGYDEAFKTGVWEWTPVLTIVVAVSFVAAMACLAYVHWIEKHGKRESRDLIRPE